jgi:hypothetical protein
MIFRFAMYNAPAGNVCASKIQYRHEHAEKNMCMLDGKITPAGCLSLLLVVCA